MNELERPKPPSKIQVIGIMHLLAGVMNVVTCLVLALYGLLLALPTFGFGLLACCPLVFMVPIAGMEIMSGVKHLGSDHRGIAPPRGLAVFEICSILACGWLSTLAGIVTLVFLNDPEVAAYYEQQRQA